MLRDFTRAKRRFARPAPRAGWLPHAVPPSPSLFAPLRESARRDARSAALFLFCTGAHGVAHGALALFAGALVRGLASGLAPMDERSTRLVGASSALALAFAGALAASVKGATAVVAAGAQARLVGEAGERLRRRALAARLRGPVGAQCQPGHGDHAPAPKLATARRGPVVGGGASDPDVGRGVASLTTSIRDVEHALAAGLLQSVRALAELAPIVVVLFLVDARLAVGAALVLAPFGWALGRLRRAWKQRQLGAMREAEALFSAADDALRHADLFRVYRAERLARARVGALGARLTALSVSLAARAQALSSANEILAALALVLVVAGASRWALAERATVVPFAVAFFLAYKPLRDLGDARLAWAKGEAALERLALPLEADAPDDEVAGPRAPTADDAVIATLGVLEVDGLRLPRGGLAEPLRFSVAPGRCLGLVAPTGKGKTTLLRVLLGLEAPLAGAVRYGGLELGPRTEPGRRPFAWVPQDTPLIAGTLQENIALGAARVDARRALRELGAGDLADALGDEAIGAGGRSLSGGERQWVALARALEAGRPVLLLDEPTSGLDAASQARVLEAIAALRGRRTVVLVTHRREALTVCDEVIELG